MVKDLGPRLIALWGMTVDLISHPQVRVGSAQSLADAQDDDGADVEELEVPCQRPPAHFANPV